MPVRPRKAKAAEVKVSALDLQTLKLAVEEHVRFSYFSALKRCVDAGLVVFDNEGRGAPRLTPAGRKALNLDEQPADKGSHCCARSCNYIDPAGRRWCRNHQPSWGRRLAWRQNFPPHKRGAPVNVARAALLDMLEEAPPDGTATAILR